MKWLSWPPRMRHSDSPGSGSAYADPWLATLMESLREKRTSPLGEVLPEFPPEQLQTNTTGLSSEAALLAAYAFHQDVEGALDELGRPLDSQSRVLDFGFGWGRISRVFMKAVSVQNIDGLDVDPEFVAITRQLYAGRGNFDLCSPFPPTQLPSASFDLVYAYSVFSHLSEPAVQAWMAEFSRLLKPGGVVAFTTRHESFLDYCAHAAQQPDATGYLRELGRLFTDIEAARRSYRAGNIVHASSIGVSGGGPRDASFYGETWIPEAFARTGFGKDWRFVKACFDPAKYDQVCLVLQRVAGAAG